MSEIKKKPVGITETILRDAHQSQIATRMTTEQMLPIIDKMDQVGYHSVECWGGATFDACLRFLKEDPWERLRKLRDGFKHTKLQMLFRGQNILGYRHYADDVSSILFRNPLQMVLILFVFLMRLMISATLKHLLRPAKRKAAMHRSRFVIHWEKRILWITGKKLPRKSRRWGLIPFVSRIWRACLCLMRQKHL